MDTIGKGSWITGHHAYKNIWGPTNGEELDHG